jgi:hypothetical protein
MGQLQTRQQPQKATTMNPIEPTDDDDFTSDADRQAFEDACCSMSEEDWDADNDWLASAGWGEM